MVTRTMSIMSHEADEDGEKKGSGGECEDKHRGDDVCLLVNS